jgi:hypothetical protein
MVSARLKRIEARRVAVAVPHGQVHGHGSRRLLSAWARSLVLKDAVLDRPRYRCRRIVGDREA